LKNANGKKAMTDRLVILSDKGFGLETCKKMLRDSIATSPDQSDAAALHRRS